MDSPALNTRSKTGPAAGVKPLKMAALGDVSNAQQQPGGRKRKMGAAAGGAGSKPKHNSSAADVRREAAAELDLRPLPLD